MLLSITPGVPVGHVSLLELNVDRVASDTGRVIGASSSTAAKNIPDTGVIFPWVPKTSQGLAPKSIQDFSIPTTLLLAILLLVVTSYQQVLLGNYFPPQRASMT